MFDPRKIIEALNRHKFRQFWGPAGMVGDSTLHSIQIDPRDLVELALRQLIHGLEGREFARPGLRLMAFQAQAVAFGAQLLVIIAAVRIMA